MAGVVTRRAYAGTHTRLKVEAAGRQFEVVADAAEGGRFSQGDPVLSALPGRSGYGCYPQRSILTARRL